MLDRQTKLKSLGITISKVGGGCCGSIRNTLAYILPVCLDIDVIPFLTEFGTPKPSFEKTSLLKIDKQHFAITGIRKISQIRFIIKDNDGEKEVSKFEEKIIEYIEWCNLK